MKTKTLSLISIFPLLVSCSKTLKVSKIVFFFDTQIDIKVEDATHDTLGMIKGIFINLDEETDNYQLRKENYGVYSINQSHDEVWISENLYELLDLSIKLKDNGAPNFNPFMGSLAKLWKEAIINKTVLSDDVITSELAKINSTSLTLKQLDASNHSAQRVGDAEVDLGGIVKGYALDKVQEYFKASNTSHYIVDAGNSSILLGEKNSKDGLYSVGIGVDKAYLELKNCFVSTSGIEHQSAEIGGVIYSHIINPTNGSATPLHDKVIVVSDKGYIGDAFSTSMMNNTIEEIKQIETQYNVKTIVINDGKIDYVNNGLEVKYH